MLSATLEKTREDICQAIGERKVIQFRYKDKLRIAEPYICGSSSANKYVMLAFQTGGHSSTNRFGWKLFELANVLNLEITETQFSGYGGERARYNPIDRRFMKTFCSIPKG